MNYHACALVVIDVAFKMQGTSKNKQTSIAKKVFFRNSGSKIISAMNPEPNGKDFADDVFKCILLKKFFCLSLKFLWVLFLSSIYPEVSIATNNDLTTNRRQAINWTNANDDALVYGDLSLLYFRFPWGLISTILSFLRDGVVKYFQFPLQWYEHTHAYIYIWIQKDIVDFRLFIYK